MKSRGGGSAWWILPLGGLLLLGLGATFAFAVADHALGRALAVITAVVVVLSPLGVGVVVERAGLKLRKEVRAEKIAMGLAPLVAVAAVGVPCFLFRNATGEALSSVPDRYGWTPAWVDAVAVRWGEALGAPQPKHRRPAPKSSEPGAPVQPSMTSPFAVDPPPIAPTALPSATPPSLGNRFSTGDPAYTEPTCDPLSDTADIQASYRSGATRATAEALATRRYPTGLEFLKVQDDRMLDAWFRGAVTFDGVVSGFSTAIHEGSHIWGAKHFSMTKVSYSVRADLIIDTQRLKNFNRSDILTKHVEPDNDQYSSVYLTGQSGAQGFNTLLDEYNAYAHSLAASYCTRDLKPTNIRESARDGILTMMYYVEVYLLLARTEHTADYAAILRDPGHRKLILTVWDRAEFWLKKSASIPALGIADDKIEKWTYAPERLEEIARVRAAK